jgi:F420-dependent oxidoreductase-like protein
MRLGINAGYAGATINLPMELIQEADRLGFHAVWTAEAYGSDAVTPLAWIGAQTSQIRLGTAIMQMPARTPAMTAMTAMTLDQLSGGRMLLGLGLSGPQVVEGWHGQAYGKPLGKTREYVSIVRSILARKEPLIHDGVAYQIPYRGDDATGLGKPLKSILHGRADIPIYLAAIGPKNVQLSAEIADGWLPIFFAPRHYNEAYKQHVDAGLAKAGRSLDAFDIAPSVPVVVSDDVNAARNAIKPFLALYVGGMGAKGKNFYYDLVVRYGYADAAEEIQALYLTGKKGEAATAVPDELVDEIALCGPKERIAERLPLWETSPITTLNMTVFDIEAIRVMAELVLGVSPTNSVTHVADKVTIEEIASKPPDISPSTGAEDPMSTEPKSASIFDHMASRVAESPSLVQSVNALFQFQITGDPGGSWVVDLKNGDGDVRTGQVEGADCTITMADDDFVNLAQGKLNPMAAFAQGKIKVDGNPMLATKLQSLFS